MNNQAVTFLKKIETGEAIIGIIGLGYVGLPLALAFAERGFTVLGFDTDPAKVDKINRGECCIEYLDPSRLSRAAGHGDMPGSANNSKLKTQKSERRFNDQPV